MLGKQQDARWTFWFSTVKELGRDCPGRSEIDKGRVQFNTQQVFKEPSGKFF